ncbi:putative Zn-dependent peptidase [Salana multivorans]|uniref:Putative Zn-dependent peptidase n=1 Tax=Salana multivorans TaxID=120377 RepID=A0A3N2D2A8_9MICO|nr:pitrilysin family protein [Salana multivorans]OJX95644.1 MAG: peptidase M16 [Micrococcales bacterium 73-15]ROR93897.1 putative Zn-dependent peptidase [Salana multivorans]
MPDTFGDEGLELVREDGTRVRRTVLPGGLRVLTEQVPATRSVSVAATVGVGSRDEHDGHHGSTHFLEHLLFKGTRRRSALDIASAFDEVGGEANAATGKESTTYYARVLGGDLPMASEVLLDMVTSAVVLPEDVELERGVILEELAMADDDPGDVADEAFASAVLGATDLGRPIGGTPDTIRAVPRDAIWEHYRGAYRPAELVVTAAGAVDHDELCELVTRAVTEGGWPLADDARPAPRRSGDPLATTPGTAVTLERPTEQSTLILGGRGLEACDPDRFTLAVLNAVLGGGMSSRLFQEVREKRGLAYSVYSFAVGHTDAGLFGLAAGCAPEHVRQVAGLMAAEWTTIAQDGITERELTRAVGQLSGSLVLGLDDVGARSSRLTRAELVFGELWSVDDSLDALRAVTADAVQRLAGELLAQPRSLVVVGPERGDLAGELLSELV